MDQIKQVEFFQHWNQQVTTCPSPQFLKDQIQVQQQSLVNAIDEMMLWVKSIVSIDRNVADNIRKVINVW